MTELFRRHRAKRAQGKKGFTLIELIIVIAILAILGTVVGVVMGGQVANAKKQAAQENASSYYGDIVQGWSWYQISETNYPYFDDDKVGTTALASYIEGVHENVADATIYVFMGTNGVEGVVYAEGDNWGLKGALPSSVSVDQTKGWTGDNETAVKGAAYTFTITIDADAAGGASAPKFVCAAKSGTTTPEE